MTVSIRLGTSGPDSLVTAETLSAVVPGTPVYVTAASKFELGDNASVLAHQVVGLSLTTTAAGFPATVATEGRVKRADWTAIVGAVALTPGAQYFLGAAGLLTLVAPTTVGLYVVRVARAVGSDTLDIEIAKSVLL